MTTCLACPNLARPTPGALYCAECHALALLELEQRNQEPGAIYIQRNDDKAWRAAGLPPRPWPVAESDWTTGRPNATCPVCYARYHYGAPAPFSHLCPNCETWLCWKPTGETKIVKRRVGRPCPKCQGPMARRLGGKFWGCERYPKCKGTRRGHDCDTIDEERPRLGLAVWVAPGHDEMGQALDEQAAMVERLEAKEKRYRRGWY